METATGNYVRIDGWVTPRLEAILRRAVEIAAEYGYLGVEHVALAIAEDGDSLPVHLWDKPLTVEGWRDAVTASLPPLPAETVTRSEALTVSVGRDDPDYKPVSTS
jgi:hypothetical protein